MSFYQSNLIEDGKLVKVFECKISGFEIGKKTEEKLKEIQANAHLKGFRKGKAPMNIIQESYFGKTFFDVINQKANVCIAEIAEKNNFKLASSPKVDLDSESSLPADRNTANIKDVTMKITYELLPEIPAVDFSKLGIQKYSLKIEEEDIAEELQKLAKTHASKEEKDGAVENGDVAVFDFTGYKDGIAFDGGTAKDYELEIGSKSFIEGFEDGLLGLKVGDEKTLNLTFPKEYHQEELAGQPVEFKVKVNKVFKQVPAKLDDELAKKFGFETLDALKEDISKALATNYENSYKNKQKNVVFERLQPLLSFDVPPSMLPKKGEENEHVHDENCNHEHDEAEKQANPIENARLSIFLMNYATEHKIQVSKQDFMLYIETMARMYGQNPRAFFDIYEKNPQMKESVYNLLFENKIYEGIFDAIPVEQKPISKKEFDDILKQ